MSPAKQKANKTKKKLEVDEETFFLAVLMQHGPPDQNLLDYSLWPTNPQFWHIADTDTWKQYVAIVTGFGEAKSRARKWYFAYSTWWKAYVRKSNRKDRRPRK